MDGDNSKFQKSGHNVSPDDSSDPPDSPPGVEILNVHNDPSVMYTPQSRPAEQPRIANERNEPNDSQDAEENETVENEEAETRASRSAPMPQQIFDENPPMERYVQPDMPPSPNRLKRCNTLTKTFRNKKKFNVTGSDKSLTKSQKSAASHKTIASPQTPVIPQSSAKPPTNDEISENPEPSTSLKSSPTRKSSATESSIYNEIKTCMVTYVWKVICQSEGCRTCRYFSSIGFLFIFIVCIMNVVVFDALTRSKEDSWSHGFVHELFSIPNWSNAKRQCQKRLAHGLYTWLLFIFICLILKLRRMFYKKKDNNQKTPTLRSTGNTGNTGNPA